jgi:hypothetical protein
MPTYQRTGEHAFSSHISTHKQTSNHTVAALRDVDDKLAAVMRLEIELEPRIETLKERNFKLVKVVELQEVMIQTFEMEEED